MSEFTWGVLTDRWVEESDLGSSYKGIRRQLSDIICQLGQLSARTTVSSDICQPGQLSDRTTVRWATVRLNCQSFSGRWTTVRPDSFEADNCQTWQFWGRQLSDLTVVSGQLSELTVCEAQLMYHQSKMLTWQYRVSQKKWNIAIFRLNLFQRSDFAFSHVFRNQNFEPVPSKHFKHTHSEY